MPSFNFIKAHTQGATNGQIHKIESDMIMESTWDNDIETKTAYLYDYYHDDEPLKYHHLHPENSNTKVPVSIKYIVNAYNSESKDQVGYYIQFKPSFNWESIYGLSYYKKDFEKKYSSEFPLGLYCDIPDEKGVYRKWLIAENGDWLGNQFPTWYILPVDHVFQWIYEGVMYQMCGVSRSQSSYNSGEWQDYKLSSVENQRMCVLPMNEISSTIFYNQRIIISAPRKEPVTWHCSKVEQTAPKGVNHLTFAQELWNEHTDVFQYVSLNPSDDGISNKYDSTRELLGMWADYNSSTVTPSDYLNTSPTTSGIFAVITYAGQNAQLKIGGNYKKFSVSFYNGSQDNPVSYISGTWSFTINGMDASALVNVLTSATSTELNANQIKLKFLKDDSYIGKVIKISFTTTTGITTSADMELKAL